MRCSVRGCHTVELRSNGTEITKNLTQTDVAIGPQTLSLKWLYQTLTIVDELTENV